MTNSVAKDLVIKNYVAEKVESYHITHNLLCPPHVVEKFDEDNLKVFSYIEVQLQVLERLQCLNFSVKPFS